MTGEKERVDAYLDTVRRLEPDIAMIDAAAGWASIAISLKRIADALDPALATYYMVPDGTVKRVLPIAEDTTQRIDDLIKRGLETALRERGLI